MPARPACDVRLEGKELTPGIGVLVGAVLIGAVAHAAGWRDMSCEQLPKSREVLLPRAAISSRSQRPKDLVSAQGLSEDVSANAGNDHRRMGRPRLQPRVGAKAF